MKVSSTLGEPPPNLDAEVLAAFEEAVHMMNAAVKLGYVPNPRIYAEVEQQMQDEAWRETWVAHIGSGAP